MKNVKFVLTEPYKIEKVEEELVIDISKVLVRPFMASVCKSDIKYYTGARPNDVLEKRLPLVLLHEGIGIVEKDGHGFKKGDKVIIVPLLGDDNYDPTVKFMSSTADGLMQKYIQMPPENLIKKPDDVPDEVAVLAEPVSVACHAIDRSGMSIGQKIAVLGDGKFGKIVYQTLLAQGFEAENFGRKDKVPKGFDAVFECVGNEKAEKAIETAIDVLKPRGTLVLLGVSEGKVGIETRKVLEKGLRIVGINRGTRKDIDKALKVIGGDFSHSKLIFNLSEEQIMEYFEGL